MLLAELDAKLFRLIQWSRDTTPDDRLDALNWAYREAIAMIRGLRAEYFLGETGDFTIPRNTIRVPLVGPAFPQPVRRIRKIIAYGPDAPIASTGSTGYGGGAYGAGPYGGGQAPTNTTTATQFIFRAAEIGSKEFWMAELAGPQNAGEILYDLLFVKGVPTLAIAPPLADDLAPFISFIYEPQKLAYNTDTNKTLDVVEPPLDAFDDVLIAGAMEYLELGVDDAQSDRWRDAKQMRIREMLHDLPVRTEQNTQYVQTDLEEAG